MSNAAITIKLSAELVNEAKRYGETFHRSAPKQIAYWSRIGKIAEENPDLPYSFIKDILLSLNEAKTSKLESFTFGNSK
jgi:hypothetical protein